MHAYLVRHGVTDETGRLLTGRLPGAALTSEGRMGASVVADQLSHLAPAAVYTSPIRRCRQTAGIVARPHGFTVKADRAFIEVDYGTWSGRKLKDLTRLKAWDDLVHHAGRFRFPGGETLGEAQRRAVAGLEKLADRHGDEVVIVVSHNDIIRTLLCHYLGMPVDHIHRLHVAPTSYSVIDLGRSGGVHVPMVNHGGDSRRGLDP